MFITGTHLPRRTMLKGLGATLALPLLDAMQPASVVAQTAAARARKVRLVAIEMVHGSAGSTQFGIAQHLWAPAATGRSFDLGPTSLKTLEPFREHLTIVSNTDVRNAEAFTLPEIGGDHFRSSAVFLTQMHPKQTQGSDVSVGTSLDQLYAQRFGQDTPIPSMQLCIENVDQSGGCSYGYSCAYTDSISWASPDQPLPMIRDPRVVFDQLFGVGATPADRKERRTEDRSILDWLGSSIGRMKKELEASGSDWKIPYFHHPLYASGMHGSQLDLRAILEPLFIKYSVDVVFSGHEHFYQRIKPQKGIYYFISGAAGKLRRGDMKPAEFTAYGNDNEYSFMLIEVTDKEMFFQCVDRLGKTLDKGTIVRKDNPK